MFYSCHYDEVEISGWMVTRTAWRHSISCSALCLVTCVMRYVLYKSQCVLNKTEIQLDFFIAVKYKVLESGKRTYKQ